MKKTFILLIIVFTITAASAQKKISTAMQYYNRGIVMIQKGNYTDAITVFNTAIQENPKLGIAYYQRGLAKLKENAKSTTNQYTDICVDFKLAAKYGYKVPAKILKEANCSGK
jgi:tetratricopeptide (TPR) repeat protein